MKNFRLSAVFVATILLLAFGISQIRAINGSGVYGGGPFYNERSTSIPNLRESGFDWVVVWTIHVMNQDGDLNFNAEFPIVENGAYVGNNHYPHFADDMALLKTDPTSIKWIEFGLAGWGSQTFGYIRDLVNSEGTGPGSTLYENFAALKAAIPEIDAISFDDEDYYDEPTTTQFAIMLADLGFKVSVCPYTKPSHWQNVVANVNAQRPGTIEDVHIQCYAGGAGNNPCTWESYFSSEINVMPGVEDGSNIASQMSSWNNQCGITGGWLWLYDDFYDNLSTVQNHADAINNNISQVANDPPGLASEPSPADGSTDISLNVSLAWEQGVGTESHDVYFGDTNPPSYRENVESNAYSPGTLDPNTTYYWRVDEINSYGTTAGPVWSFTTGSTTEVDHTLPVGSGTISARAEINSSEGAEKAFDNLYSDGTQNVDWSKWLDNGGTPSTYNPSWIQIELSEAEVVNKMSIVSANDDFGRDPEDFILKASSDGNTWVNLGSWSGEAWSQRFLRRDFAFSNSVAYSFYRLEITKNDENVSMTQLCEIMLWGPEGETDPDPDPEIVDHTLPVGSGTISARAEINSSEGAEKAFDNLYSDGTQNVDWSKWLDDGGTPSTSNPSWIQIELSSAEVVNELSIVSANDDFGRDPEDFILKASNDGNTWVNLGSWSGEAWNQRFLLRDFAFSNSVAYSFYRLEITKNDENVSMTQLCEIMLWGPEGSTKSASGKEPTLKSDVGELICYPNPFNEVLNIDSDREMVSITLWSMAGRPVYQQLISGNNATINTSTLRSGIYFIEIEYHEGINVKKQLIKR